MNEMTIILNLHWYINYITVF